MSNAGILWHQASLPEGLSPLLEELVCQKVLSYACLQ